MSQAPTATSSFAHLRTEYPHLPATLGGASAASVSAAEWSTDYSVF
jgi:hypothetical protein